MPSISGQFHAYSTSGTAKRLADFDFFAGLERRDDVEQEAHPPAFVLDNDDRIVAAERSGKADRAAGGGGHGTASGGGKGQAAGADAVGGNSAESLDNRSERR